MKNIRLVMSKKGFDILKAFADDSYLYNYIVNNPSELWEDNILNNPDVLQQYDEDIFFSKDYINEDDEYVLKDSITDVKAKNISYYMVLIDSETKELTVYKHLFGRVNIPVINVPINEDDFTIIEKLENLSKELSYEEEMEA